MKNVLGIIFADNHSTKIGEITNQRPLAAVPVAGRYRCIDFVLSNMVNSGMINIAVVTKNNYHSLMDHLGSGKAWNLSRKKYGLYFHESTFRRTHHQLCRRLCLPGTV